MTYTRRSARQGREREGREGRGWAGVRGWGGQELWLGRDPSAANEWPKDHMLHHRELVEDLALVESEHAARHCLPVSELTALSQSVGESISEGGTEKEERDLTL
jgi:hypothetical protein